MSSVGRKKNLESFLNAKKTIQLPSNLLNAKRDIAKNAQTVRQRPNKLFSNQARFPKTVEAPNYIEQKSDIPERSVLYKRLSNIRGDNKELGGLSFSKMLSRMVVMGDDQDDTPATSSFDHRMRQTSYVRPVEQKLYSLKCESATGRLTKSIDVDAQKRPSRKLFKKYYMPSSEATQTLFLESHKHEKYIYREGKRVECKRIHNFYTSHMFRQGYDKCFRGGQDKRRHDKSQQGCKGSPDFFSKTSENFQGR